MTNHFDLQIPTSSNQEITHTLNVGQVLYIVGANGTGKSSLVLNFHNQHSNNSKRIVAHRQMWFDEHSLGMSYPQLKQFVQQAKHFETSDTSRYRHQNSGMYLSKAIYDLMDMYNMHNAHIAHLAKTNDTDSLKREATNSSAIEIINDLLKQSNISLEISIEQHQRLMASKNEGKKFDIEKLSDGERSAFIIAAEVLTASPNSLIIIDEPERHLHRSIASPLLKLLFEQRKDCAFVVSTHELALPIDTPSASTLLVRSCDYNIRSRDIPLRSPCHEPSSAQSWNVDILPSGAEISDDVKRDIIGARKTIIFVEGTQGEGSKSLDVPLYSLLFPHASVIGKGSCRDVMETVRGLRGAERNHWVNAYGIIDGDHRSDEEKEKLKQDGIWALSCYAVEALYYHSTMIRRIAQMKCDHGEANCDVDTLFQRAIDAGIAAIKSQKDQLILKSVSYKTRKKIQENYPKEEEIKKLPPININFDVAEIHAEECEQFDVLIANEDWDGLISQYPRRHGGLDKVASQLNINHRDYYPSMAINLLKRDPDALDEMRARFDGLYTQVSAHS